ncbi:L,D-transpeptidase [Nocardioides sp. HDW12B]|uniref:L,D-transpeptidase n=1 Tax=Nocardioides sp. HDW12B TaxID=2714939 RepID=UPI001408C544|nr:Ig-like domain-containing protein [Nocardioides sp. HDW12B]QIK66047.1 L,D-transpeptidase [Nocardioides sp. HDW12B]
MPSRRARSARTLRRSVALSTAAVTAVGLLGACSIIEGDGSSPSQEPGSSDRAGARAEGTVAKPQSAVRLDLNLPARAQAPVPVDTLLAVSAESGSLDKVSFTTGRGAAVPGEMNKKGTAWTASERLEPGTTYRVEAKGEDADGLPKTLSRTFRTADLTLDDQTYASIAPLDGETVGVGMPVIVTFDVPVTDRAEIERHLDVQSSPVQQGSWYWMSDTEVHWRPKTYWKPGTEVTVDADVNGVNAGNGIFGQEDREASFTVGDSLFMNIDVQAHTMKVVENGRLLRTIPISAGKPGFTTRSGVKVIIEKFESKRMDAATTGISESDPEYYNLSNVQYAQRVTYSGEFIHAAPWSVGSQGSENVSHGCVGMSTENAGWLYSLTQRGDVVDVTGTDRPMELSNGFGDWNLSWADYQEGSAL